MAGESGTLQASRCLECGFEAQSGGSAWNRIDIPGVGRMTRCPECGSTNVIAPR